MDISTGIIFGIIAMIAWGTSDIFLAKASRNVGVLKTVIWSQIISLALYSSIFLLFFDIPIITTYTISIVSITGLLSAIGYLAYSKGLQIGKISVISPITASWAVITVILSLIFLNETVTYTQSIGIVLAILGTILASFRLSDLLKVRLKKRATGIEYALITVFATGIYFVFISILVAELSWFLPIFFMKIAALFYMLAYAGAKKTNIQLPKNTKTPIMMIGILEAIGFLAYGIGVNSEYTAIVAPISATFPVVAIILARIFFKETLKINQKIGIILVLTGIILLTI